MANGSIKDSMTVSEVSLIAFLGSCGLHVVIAITLFNRMGPLPSRYDSDWLSRLFQGKNAKLILIAAINMVIMFTAIGILGLASRT